MLSGSRSMIHGAPHTARAELQQRVGEADVSLVFRSTSSGSALRLQYCQKSTTDQAKQSTVQTQAWTVSVPGITAVACR